MNNDEIFSKLRKALESKALEHNLLNENISIKCKTLTAKEAIGEPEHDDYPIIKGKEVMVEADFLGAKGHAFTDNFENQTYKVKDLLSITLDSNSKRASFISALNAIYRSLGLCEKTVHCRDQEPGLCAKELPGFLKSLDAKFLDSNAKFSVRTRDSNPGISRVLLVGFQPRFLEILSQNFQTRAVDLDADNVGKTKFGVEIESVENTQGAADWCDLIFATGSTIVNGSTANLLELGKPICFYGVTISAAAKILNLCTFCTLGH